jgi:hypothetical protein
MSDFDYGAIPGVPPPLRGASVSTQIVTATLCDLVESRLSAIASALAIPGEDDPELMIEELIDDVRDVRKALV